MTLNLTILNSTSSLTSMSACNSYMWRGTTYTTSGIYWDTIPNAAGCDSVMTLNLTINTADTSIVESGNTLASNVDNATCQWIDCSNGDEPIAGATDQSFTPTASGSYAVIVTQDGCTDTSSCYSVTITGILNNALSDALRVYPNPTFSALQVDLGKAYEQVSVKIETIHGQTVLTKQLDYANTFAVEINGRAGMYIMTIITKDGKHATLSILKE